MLAKDINKDKPVKDRREFVKFDGIFRYLKNSELRKKTRPPIDAP